MGRGDQIIRKRLVFLITILIIIIILSVKFPSSQAENKAELSILEAVKLAYPLALEWDENAQLLEVINVDLDKPGMSIGSNGKRKYWNVQFAVPDTNLHILVTIHEGEVSRVVDLTKKGNSPIPKKQLIKLSDVNYDSPQLLKSALKKGGIQPGKDWAKGYNYSLYKDPETNITLILVIGWNSDYEEMVAINFNATNGKLVKPN